MAHEAFLRRVSTLQLLSNGWRSNKLIRSRYTVLNFIPYRLLAHAQRVTHLYFFVTAIFQSIPNISTWNAYSIWAPVVAFFLVVSYAAARDDYYQHQRDKAVNEAKFTVIRNQVKKTVKAQDITCGDLVFLDREVECPADMVIVRCESDDGNCLIDASSLTGESPLEGKRVIDSRSGNQGIPREELETGTFTLWCDEPNPVFGSFVGMFCYRDGWRVDVGIDNFMAAGTRLTGRDATTELVVGMVCYTGKDTKRQMNAGKPTDKKTKIEKMLDKWTFVIFIAQLLISVVFTLIADQVPKEAKEEHAYLRYDLGEETSTFVIFWQSWVLLSSTIPVTLGIALMLCESLIYKPLIMADPNMSSDEEHPGAEVNNSTIIEDLGSVDYLFLDKTSTLTNNDMIIDKLWIGDDVYGGERENESIYQDEAMKALLQSESGENDGKRQLLLMAIACLSTCHEVEFRGNGEDEEVLFDGTSPDDICCLESLKKLGIRYRPIESILAYSCPDLGIREVKLEKLTQIPFDQSRGCSSVVVRDIAAGKSYVFSKGSPEILVGKEQRERAVRLVKKGMRVLAMSYKELEDNWNESPRENGQFVTMMDIWSSLQDNMKDLGIVAIRHELIDDVPDTISVLREAGIRIWMATGDSALPAISFARLAKIISSGANVIDLTPWNAQGEPMFSAVEVLDEVSKIQDGIGELNFLIDGMSPLLQDYLGRKKSEFVSVVQRASCVICSKATAKCKADLVTLIKSKTKKVVLAVGNGANDVKMMNAASVGVGIGTSREKRKQANPVADFTVSAFGNLRRLLLIHGRYAYYRSSLLIQLCLYESTMVSVCQIIYMFWNYFSASSFIDQFNIVVFNHLFTILPVCFIGFDRDLDEVTVQLHPYVYEDSRENMFLNFRKMFSWVFRGFIQGFAIMSLTYGCCTADVVAEVDGRSISLAEMQQMVYTGLVLTMLITVALETKSFGAWSLLFLWGSWLFYLAMAVALNFVSEAPLTRNIYHSISVTFTNPLYWIIIATGVSVSVLIVFALRVLYWMLYPTRGDRLREREIIRGSQWLPLYQVDLSKDNDLQSFGSDYHLQPRDVALFPCCPKVL